MNERALAEKINLHLKMGAATPGFHLSEDDLCMIVRALLRGVDTSTDHRCQRCGCETKDEMAWVDGQIWCHPCADEAAAQRIGRAIRQMNRR